MNARIQTNSLESETEERELFEMLLSREVNYGDRTPIQRRDEIDSAPLSSAQERLWQLEEDARNLPLGNVGLCFRIFGAFQISAAQRAFDELVWRHEMLRTTFENVDGIVRLRIHPPGRVPIRMVDVRAVAEAEREEVVRAVAVEEVRRVFDLSRDRLIRTAWIRIDEDESCLAVTTHHLAVDGWAMRIFLQEFSNRYRAVLCETAEPLPPLAIQYADFAIWEQQRLDSGACASQFCYWRTRLDGIQKPAFSHWPRPSVQNGRRRFESSVERFELSPELSDSIRQFSRASGVTLYMTFVALLNRMVHQCGQHDDVVIGTVISVRNRPETERLIGNFGNYLFLRTACVKDEPFRELLWRTRDVILQAYSNADFPVQRLRERFEQETQRTLPPMDFMFVLRDTRLDQNLDLPGVQVVPYMVDAGVAPVDLKLDVADGAASLEVTIEFNRSRFNREWALKFIDELRAVAEHELCDSP